MFKRLKLNNFRQHRDREFHFTPGVNAIRGLNESGKTTLLEAAAYVLFGSRIALRESLDDVVSYGEKVSSLKTELDIDINGTVYLGKRSKAGAEVWLQGGIAPAVVGQDECTNFWASLLGVSPKTAANLMLANQQSIRGALEGGAAAPVLLIEQLANFKVIDKIIGIVKVEVPNGRPSLVTDRIAVLEKQVAEAVVEDTTDLKVAADVAAQLAAAAGADRNAAQKDCDDHRPSADAAQNVVNDLQMVKTQYGSAGLAHAAAKAAVEKAVVPAAPDLSGIEELRKGVSDAARFQRAQVARAALDTLTVPEIEWDEGMDALLADIKSKQADAQSVRGDLQKLRDRVIRVKAAIIKETTCAFCQKDLTDVPEVTTHNKKLTDELLYAEDSQVASEALLATAEGDVADLQAVVTDSNARNRVYQRVAEFITLDEAFVPARWTWTGPDVAKPVTDPSAQIKALEAAQRAYDSAVGAKAQAEAALAVALTRWEELERKYTLAGQAADKAQPVLDKAKELATALAAAEVALQNAQRTHQTAQGAYETAAAVQRERERSRDRLKADLQAEQIKLAEIGQGNRLLDKLSGARPQIADKLWAVVLHSVSSHFTSIRGQASVVTRADNGFLVDGRPIDGLSGSTLDALGLAIRIALVKTFLPNCGFMVLDEPQAACDDERGVNMLGLVASAGFDQIILVTHSDLSDSVAQQVIQL